MVCFHVLVPGDGKVTGVTADGQPTTALPGNYFVHLLQPKIPAEAPLVRFVGGDPMCRDVHVPQEIALRYLARSANDDAARAA